MIRLLLFLLSLTPVLSFSQKKVEVTRVQDTPEAIVNLNNSAFFTRDKEQNHLVVDMVNVYTIDSTFTRKTERHRVIGGGLIRLLGFRWKSIDQTRQKMVGWVNKHYLHGVNEEAHFTEYDINYDLIPSLDKYIDLAFYAYKAQLSMKKAKKKKEADQVPFIYPQEDSDLTKYRFHCENTPAIDFRTQLNTMFYPVHRNNELSKHHNFMNPNPVMGMYGVMVLDCNHGCHPEIHPYEWIWWLNLTEEKTSWNVGFLRDVSNRFKHWSSAPRTGEISIPFTFPLDEGNWTIQVNHQILGNFSEEGFAKLDLEGEYFSFEKSLRVFELQDEKLVGQSIKVKSNVRVPYKSLKYAIKNVKLDQKAGVLSGELNLAMSINEVYTAEISTSSTPIEFKETDFGQLLDLMQGSFSSQLQAQQDSSYSDISLHMYPIWVDLEPGWLYVEQAISSKPNQPYRQRVYHVQQIDATSFKSDVYLLPNDSISVGRWKEPTFFKRWTPNDLVLKQGCAVYLKKIADKQFKGSTLEGTCLSDFQGASYATSMVDISKGKLTSWDRGFNIKGEHIWGAEKGGYKFLKLK